MEPQKSDNNDQPPTHPSVQKSVLDCVREKAARATMEGLTDDASFMDVVAQIHEHIIRSERTTRSAMSTQLQHSMRLTEIVAGHSTMLDILWSKHVGRKSSQGLDKGPKSKEGVCASKRKVCSSARLEMVASKAKDVRRLCGEKQMKVDVKRSKGKCNHTKKAASRGDKPCQKPLKRKLEFSMASDSDVEVSADLIEFGTPYNNGRNRCGLVQGEDMPQVFYLMFRPPDGMFFSNLELAVVSYVFDAHLDKSEHTQGDRFAFCTLCPGEELIDDVINLLATVLTDERSEPSWWLPTSFAIYIPLHKDRHWFLMVVDLKEELLIYLDSLKDHSERDARVDQMTYVAFFLQTILRDRKLYSKCDSVPPTTSAYRVREPITGQQDPTSRGCGIWVAQWMQLSNIWTSYDIEGINDHNKMRLALDLIMAKSNPTRDEICKLSCKHWEETLDNPATRGTPQGTQPPAEASSNVSSSSKSLTI
ncbi:Ulp1 protease family, carboxy-terminal domain protein [Arachis hypogaea]|nr:Ulp1 protease family, carboxy-terminal domain protein [Arachis hypogaea]